MNNIVELTFEQIDGNAYSVKFTGTSPAEIFPASVPTFAPHYYQRYQAACDEYHEYQQTRLGLKSKQVKNKEELDRLRKDVQKSAKDLLDNFNRWGDAPEFARIAQAISARSDNLQVKISTNCPHLRKLPFHQWQLFPKNTEAIFSGIEAKEWERKRHPDKIRILVILGDNKGIDITTDRQEIEQYCGADAEIVFLPQPDRDKLTATLADPKGWDIIFFSGHSDSVGDTGRIYINATDSLTIAELKEVLAPAIAKRVQIAIFNSCDGLGITPVFEDLNIDRLIVMRQQIPDEVAQQFLKNFLQAFTSPFADFGREKRIKSYKA